MLKLETNKTNEHKICSTVFIIESKAPENAHDMDMPAVVQKLYNYSSEPSFWPCFIICQFDCIVSI